MATITTTTRRTSLRQAISDARNTGAVWISPAISGLQHGVDAAGMPHLTVVFDTAEHRRAWSARYHRTWIETWDRCGYLDYELTWLDSHGHGISLTTSDYPRAVYGGRNPSKLAQVGYQLCGQRHAAGLTCKTCEVITPEIVAWARAWVLDCDWADDVSQLTDVQVIRGVRRHYEGGLVQFLADSFA